jgi:hypothetical protein
LKTAKQIAEKTEGARLNEEGERNQASQPQNQAGKIK